jgi:hypothetical protein
MRLTIFMLLLGGLTTMAYADDWSKRYPVSATPELRVEAGDGRIEVTTGAGNVISAHVRTEGWRLSPSEVNIVEHQSGNNVEIEVKIPRHQWHLDWSSRSIVVELHVPAKTSSFLETGDGSIHVNGLRGPADLRSGDGAIEAMDFDGNLSVHTGDGHVKVRGRLDVLNVETGDGGVEVELAGGSRVSSGWRIHTGDGHVTVRVPQDLKANLEAHTGDGSVTVDVPIIMEGTFKSRSDIRGKLNGGGEIFSIHTGDGPIRIERG